MANKERVIEVRVPCSAGKTTATLLVPAYLGLVDNSDTHVLKVCKGCKRLSAEELAEAQEIFSNSNRNHLFEQHVVNKGRMNGGEFELVVLSCTSIGAK